MSLVERKCSQCGGMIQMDESNEKGICPFCDSEYFFPKTAVDQRKEGGTINVQNENVDNYIELVSKLFNQNNFDEATKYLSQAFVYSPNDARLWLLKLKILCALVQSTNNVIKDDFIGTLNEIIELTIEKEHHILHETVEVLYNLHISCAEEFERLKNDKNGDKQAISAKEKLLSEINILIIGTMIHNILLDKRCPDEILDLFLKMDMDQAKSGIEYSRCPYCILYATPFGLLFDDDPILQVSELKVRNKKGKEKDPSHIGTYLLYWIKKEHPDYSTSILNMAEKLMNEKEAEGCYIATCVYGSYDCQEVWVLRRFRDCILAGTWYGRTFIKVYYAISPKLVDWFGETTWFKGICKKTLDKLVAELRERER